MIDKMLSALNEAELVDLQRMVTDRLALLRNQSLLTPEEHRLMRSGDKIAAIKSVRYRRTDLDLRGAKLLVESEYPSRVLP